jgi:hypothetical protein
MYLDRLSLIYITNLYLEFNPFVFVFGTIWGYKAEFISLVY